jgi:hypothetical protein
MRSILICTCTVLFSLAAPGCGGRSGLTSGGGAATDGQVPSPDTTCARPKGGCNGPSDCEKGQVCSTSLGECSKDPCCPQCAACYGHCVVQTFFAEVTSASAFVDFMPPITSTDPSVDATIRLTNTSAKPQTGVAFTGGLIGIPMGPMVYSLTNIKMTPISGTLVSGTLAPKSTVVVRLSAKGKYAGGSTGAPCSKKTYVRINVGFKPGNTLRADSKSFTFGCTH